MRHLASDRIRWCLGLPGTEPTDVKRVFRDTPDDWAYLSIALNTFYPELPGGYFINRRLIAEIQCALEECGIACVLNEVYAPGGINPAEYPGTLLGGETYEVVVSTRRVGRLFAWEFDAGGGVEFYRDSFTLTFRLEAQGIDALSKILARLDASEVSSF